MVGEVPLELVASVATFRNNHHEKFKGANGGDGEGKQDLRFLCSLLLSSEGKEKSE
jgi:hypothetical protein